MDPKSLRELWNSSSKAAPGKFHWSCGHSKPNCLQDRTNFQRSRAWQIVLILTLLSASAKFHFDIDYAYTGGAFCYHWIIIHILTIICMRCVYPLLSFIILADGCPRKFMNNIFSWQNKDFLNSSHDKTSPHRLFHCNQNAIRNPANYCMSCPPAES